MIIVRGLFFYTPYVMVCKTVGHYAVVGTLMIQYFIVALCYVHQNYLFFW